MKTVYEQNIQYWVKILEEELTRKQEWNFSLETICRKISWEN